ncbi:hypothetical protein S40288_04252 [Stachybotrys chartarum IBT 40288]|nr:hypothetical protein S40288_04252 [Stachybotrys chartarum IBT 40288]
MAGIRRKPLPPAASPVSVFGSFRHASATLPPHPLTASQNEDPDAYTAPTVGRAGNPVASGRHHLLPDTTEVDVTDISRDTTPLSAGDAYDSVSPAASSLHDQAPSPGKTGPAAEVTALPQPHLPVWTSGRTRRMWSPIWLSKTILLVFAAVFALLTLATALLYYFSVRFNGIVAENDSNHYGWRYGLTALLVVIGALWRQVDHINKILMLWKELKNGPASVEKFLLPDYVTPMLPTSLWMSLRNRHWAVSMSVLGHLSVLLATVFSTGLLVLGPTEVTREREDLRLNSEIRVDPDVDPQTAWMVGPAPAQLYYGIHSQGLQYPPGTAQDFAVPDLISGITLAAGPDHNYYHLPNATQKYQAQFGIYQCNLDFDYANDYVDDGDGMLDTIYDSFADQRIVMSVADLRFAPQDVLHNEPEYMYINEVTVALCRPSYTVAQFEMQSSSTSDGSAQAVPEGLLSLGIYGATLRWDLGTGGVDYVLERNSANVLPAHGAEERQLDHEGFQGPKPPFGKGHRGPDGAFNAVPAPNGLPTFESEPLSTGFMCEFFSLLVLISVGMIFVRPHCVVPHRPCSIASTSTILASSPNLHQTLIHAEASRLSHIRRRLQKFKFQSMVSPKPEPHFAIEPIVQEQGQTFYQPPEADTRAISCYCRTLRFCSIKSRHFAVTVALLANFIGGFLTIVVSGLYAPRPVLQTQNVTVAQTDAFALSGVDLSYSDNHASAIDGLITYLNLNYAQWTHENLVFNHLNQTTVSVTNSSDIISLSASVPAARARLNCTAIPVTDRIITYVEDEQSSGIGIAAGMAQTWQTIEGRAWVGLNTAFRYLDWCESSPSRNTTHGDWMQYYEIPNDTTPSYIGRASVMLRDWSDELIYGDGAIGTDPSSMSRIGIDSLETSSHGCPSFAVTLGKITASPERRGNRTSWDFDHDVATVMCYQNLEQVTTNVTWELPDIVLKEDAPPQPDESSIHLLRNADGSARHDFVVNAWLARMDDATFNRTIPGPGGQSPMNNHIDQFINAMVFGKHGRPLQSRVGEANSGHIAEAANDLYSAYMAQAISLNMRSDTNSDGSALASYSGQVRLANRQRLQQNMAPKIALQVMLGVMAVCAIVTRLLLQVRAVLPHNLCSIAGAASMLAGARMVSREVIPPGAEWRNDQELRHEGIFNFDLY